jgi:predicted nucleic acid-binding protein
LRTTQSLIRRDAKPSELKKVQALLVAASARNFELVVPAAVIAELYRGTHAAGVDAWLNRHRAWMVQDTTRELAHVVGRLLDSAGRGSEDHVDGCVVASAIVAGGGTIITGDPRDISAIAAGNAAVNVVAL